MAKIVVLDGYTMNPGDLNWNALEKLGDTEIYERTLPEQTLERAKDASILIVNKHLLNADILSQLPELKCICVSATGFNNVDIEFAKSKGIPVCNVINYSTFSVAQHVFSLILNFQNRPQDHSDAVHEGKWTESPDFSFHLSPIRDLARKTIGIYGFGRIGQKVAEIAQAFDMKVKVTHKHPQRDRGAGIEFVRIEDLFAESDFISLHAPLNIDNAGVVNRRLLELMKPTAYLINTARGPLINELDLKEALEANTLAGAALDVLSVEPPSAEHPLLGVKNCIITPHIAWATVEARTKLMNSTKENVKAFLEGRPRNVVNNV